ncbi:MAG: xanthine dehydrogenase molybdopterin binding subunit [Alphaproteobacteria bacterium]|nr:xanthine dehydrogenase molybdopterin binding subunit [Alphaproteobacteria bacterium]
MSKHAPSQAGIVGGVHQAMRHDSAVGHVTGGALYIDDIPMTPNTLHAALVLSEKAHAAILEIDIEAALALEGVVAVYTAGDIPGRNQIGPIQSDEPALADGLVEHIGQPIAIVIAATLDQARAGVKRVSVAYDERPAILSIEEALAADQMVSAKPVMARGDVTAALEAAPHRLQGEFRNGGQDHFYLEGQVALAIPGEASGQAGEMLIHSSTQHPTEVQHGAAHVLGRPFAAITVQVRRMGGAFGGKESQATIIGALAALGAAKTGRPVKLRLPRDDDMVATGKRHPFLFRYDVGFDGQGRIHGLDLMLAANGGHVADLTAPVLTRALCHADNCYYIPALKFSGAPCKTNTVSNTAFRGFGGPQGMLAIEGVIDRIAAHLGVPNEDIRRANYYDWEGARTVTPYGMAVEDNIIDRVNAELEAAADWDAWREEIDAFNASNPVLKKGLARMPIKFGISFNRPTLNQAGALVHVYTDGSVHLNHGGTEMGQGLYQKVAQVAAEGFQIDIGNVHISATATDKVPNTSATAASSGSDLNGMAALNAVEQIKTRMAAVAADLFDAPVDEILFAENRIFAGNRSIPFPDLAQKCWERRVSLSAVGYYKTPGLTWDFKNNTGAPFYYFTYGAAASEVAIDTLTGECRVLRTEIVQDCGSSLNPAIDLGQIEGAFVQGMGWLTCEELWWDAGGRLRTHGPSTYKIPGSRDVPPIFNTRILTDAANPKPTIFRSKAIGEPPFMLAISVWLAIKDAVASLAGPEARRHTHVELDAPATPERILAAVNRLRGAMPAAAE